MKHFPCVIPPPIHGRSLAFRLSVSLFVLYILHSSAGTSSSSLYPSSVEHFHENEFLIVVLKEAFVVI